MASTDDLKVTNFEIQDDKGGQKRVIGVVENISDKTYSYVEVQFNFYDEKDIQVDSVSDSVTNLEPHSQWSFYTTSTFREAASAKLIRIVGDEAATNDGSFL
jgi:hypothetical protein